MLHVRVVTVVGNVDQEAPVAKAITGSRHAELVLRCLEKAELLAAIRGAHVDLVVVVGAPLWFDAHAIFEIAERGARLVGIASDPLEADSLARLGVDVAQPGASIADLLRAADREFEPAVAIEPKPIPKGKLVAVWGPKGAPGRTTVAVQLAAEIAAREPRTALVDADTYGGDIAQMLAIVEELPTIVWGAQMAAEGRLDAEKIASMLRRTSPSGPVLLPGIDRTELWNDISTFGWERLLDVFLGSFAFSIIDVGFGLEGGDGRDHDRDRLARQTIAEAHHVVGVCRADPVGMKTFLWSAERLKAIRPLDDVTIVANQVAPGDADEVRYILKKHVGKRPLVCLPHRPGETRAAIDRGVVIREMKPASDLVSQIRELAVALGASVPVRGVLSRLGGRS